jgi:hypothetical protein
VAATEEQEKGAVQDRVLRTSNTDTHPCDAPVADNDPFRTPSTHEAAVRRLSVEVEKSPAPQTWPKQNRTKTSNRDLFGQGLIEFLRRLF